jgi:transposase
MKYRTGPDTPKDGFFNVFLEPLIGEDNTVRVIDAFVDALDLASLGFAHVCLHKTGAPPYDPALLLKLYFYGYFNRIRSSRMLERECARNVELWWLLDRATPSYHTIATFRTYRKKDEKGQDIINHRKALVAVFRIFNKFCDQKELFGKTLFAVDGTKIAAQNAKKRHIREDKLKRKLERVDHRIEEYLEALDSADTEKKDEKVSTEEIAKALEELKSRKIQIQEYQKQLTDAQAQDPTITQISFTDPDARMLPINNEGMMQIAYNVQAVVDDKHYLIADYAIENQKDLYLLSQMGASVKHELGIEGSIELLADKGYHSAQGLHECEENEIIPYVAFPEQAFKDRPKGFRKPDFKYDSERDVYICPDHKILKTKGTLHVKKGRHGHIEPSYKLYRSSFSVCSICQYKDQCLSAANISQRHGRTIERGEYEESVIANRARILAQRDKYKRRQAIVEHPFGTIKRSWGAYYTLLKGKEKVGGEMAIVFTVYNLRRVINILGVKTLLQALKTCFFQRMTLSLPIQAAFIQIPRKGGLKTAFDSSRMVALGMAV